MTYKSDYPENDNDELDPLESRQFYELMQKYRHAPNGTLEFEAVKTWLRESMNSQTSMKMKSMTKQTSMKMKQDKLYAYFSVQNPDRSPHWSEGGTAVTNFGENQVGKYLKAIEKYGDSSLFVGHPTSKGFVSDFALRRSGGMRGDLSAFWRVFDSIE